MLCFILIIIIESSKIKLLFRISIFNYHLFQFFRTLLDFTDKYKAMDSPSDLNNISSPTRYSLTPRERDRERDGSNTVVKDVPRYLRTCVVDADKNISLHKRYIFECD